MRREHNRPGRPRWWSRTPAEPPDDGAPDAGELVAGLVAGAPTDDAERADGERTGVEPADAERADGEPADSEPAVAEPADGEPLAGRPADGPPPRRVPVVIRPSRVRPYTLTRGRTQAGLVLLVETLVTTLDCPGPADGHDEMPEVTEIIELCRGVRSVAEVAALLRMPLGVVRVLVSDLAAQGRISVYRNDTTDEGAARPDRALLERVLGGLRRL